MASDGLPFSVFAAYLRSLLNSNFLVLQLFSFVQNRTCQSGVAIAARQRFVLAIYRYRRHAWLPSRVCSCSDLVPRSRFRARAGGCRG